ncbi:MAG: hypothetical protein JWN40_5185, partial [Phycisphaerales bacterium]|nr:hypothetical protein [Phycisphaerales bacterium]
KAEKGLVFGWESKPQISGFRSSRCFGEENGGGHNPDLAEVVENL